MKKLSLKSIKEINVGDVIEITPKDVKFFEGLFSKANELFQSAEIFMQRRNKSFDEAWKAFYKAYPVFQGYEMVFNLDDGTFTILRKTNEKNR